MSEFTDTGRFEIERRVDTAKQLASMQAALDSNTSNLKELQSEMKQLISIQHATNLLDSKIIAMQHDFVSMKSELDTWRTVRRVGGWLLGIASVIAGAASLKYFNL